MYDYIKGEIAEISPAHAILENNGIGYFFHISVHTFTQIGSQKQIQLFVYENIREDAYNLYGFYDKEERSIFQHLISVSGVGANTARMMLSSMTPSELGNSIISENVNQLKGIKGIGAKTAQRIIVELKDKLEKSGVEQKLFVTQDNTIKEEALSALVMLGFAKNVSQKAVDKILSESPSIKVEEVIKKALKLL